MVQLHSTALIHRFTAHSLLYGRWSSRLIQRIQNVVSLQCTHKKSSMFTLHCPFEGSFISQHNLHIHTHTHTYTTYIYIHIHHLHTHTQPTYTHTHIHNLHI